MAWLGNWAKRIKIIIDKDQVDGNLENFPVPIYLSASAGQSSDDVSAIFDELTSDDNRKKIAVTVSGTGEQCYVEIERWDDNNEKAWLHINIPSISSSVDTTLYIYYDSTQSNNTTYVGDVGSTPAQSVWDSSFKAVYHLGEYPTTGSGCMLDSTSNVNHGTPGGAMTSEDLVDGRFGKCLDFDGTDDIVNFGNAASVDDITTKTIEAVIDPDTLGATSHRIIHKYTIVGWTYYLDGGNNRVRFFQTFSGVDGGWYIPYTTGVQHAALTYDRGNVANNPIFYKNGVSVTPITEWLTPTDIVDSESAVDLRIGNDDDTNQYTGKIDEVRISSIIRTAAWLKATYEGLWDNLLTFGASEDVPLSFVFSDPIPTQSGIVYGTTQQLCLTTTISGPKSNYIYDAIFYNNVTDLQIGSTASDIQSGEQTSVYMDTPSGIEYSWYVEATSSGQNSTSNVYSFTNRFLFSGDVYEGNYPASGIPVRLYRRNTGQLVGLTTSAAVSGTFEIVSTYNEDHYVVALYTTSGTNALIYDYIRP